MHIIDWNPKPSQSKISYKKNLSQKVIKSLRPQLDSLVTDLQEPNLGSIELASIDTHPISNPNKAHS